MAKQIGITLDDDVYEDLVQRAGGPRKLSKFLNPLLRVVVSQFDAARAPATGQFATLQDHIRELAQRIDRLENNMRVQGAEPVPNIPPNLACAVASEEVLGRDWLSPEDEEAWRHL